MSDEFRRQWKWHMQEGYVKVVIPVPDTNGKEWLWCEPVDDKLLRVKNVPFFVDEPSFNDVIEVTVLDAEQNFYRFGKVVEHITEPLFFHYESDESDEELTEKFGVFHEACKEHDFRIENLMRGYVVVAVPWGTAEKSKQVIVDNARALDLELVEMDE